jgi:hypothetical protein
MSYVLACARAASRLLLEQRVLLAAVSPGAAPLQARRLRASRGALDDAVKKGATPSGGGGGRGASALVDPSKDARPKELFAIPLKKPLIPGAPLLRQRPPSPPRAPSPDGRRRFRAPRSSITRHNVQPGLVGRVQAHTWPVLPVCAGVARLPRRVLSTCKRHISTTHDVGLTPPFMLG